MPGLSTRRQSSLTLVGAVLCCRREVLLLTTPTLRLPVRHLSCSLLEIWFTFSIFIDYSKCQKRIGFSWKHVWSILGHAPAHWTVPRSEWTKDYLLACTLSKFVISSQMYLSIYSLITFFTHHILHSSLHSPITSFTHHFIQPPLHSLNTSFTNPFIHPPLHSLTT